MVARDDAAGTYVTPAPARRIDPGPSFAYRQSMEAKAAIEALAALAQEHRLRVFRLLMREGPDGLAAGRIAERIGIPASTLSSHLAQLERAGLIRSWRIARNIYYAPDIEGAGRLIAFLTEDCCQGHPEICGYATRDCPE